MAGADEEHVGMNVSVTPELARFVQERVETGMCSSASEVVREALRLLAERDGAEPVRGASSPALSVSQWQDLREALLRGEARLSDERASDIAALFGVAIETMRTRLRREDPGAPEEGIEARLAKWLRERGGEPDGTPSGEFFAEVSEERRRRILGE